MLYDKYGKGYFVEKKTIFHTNLQKGAQIFEWPGEPSKLLKSSQIFLELFRKVMNFRKIMALHFYSKKCSKPSHPIVHFMLLAKGQKGNMGLDHEICVNLSSIVLSDTWRIHFLFTWTQSSNPQLKAPKKAYTSQAQVCRA
jgi:hypothetical protein